MWTDADGNSIYLERYDHGQGQVWDHAGQLIPPPAVKKAMQYPCEPSHILNAPSNCLVCIVSSQLEFTPEQIEGKVGIMGR